MKFILLFLFLLPNISSSSVLVVRDVSDVSNFTDYQNYEIFFVNSPESFTALYDKTKSRPGSFPAIVDPFSGVWISLNNFTNLTSAQNELINLYQQTKPLEQRQYENQFFNLIEELYNATGVTNEVTPKLGFPEIRELIDTVQASDPMAAVNYSLELLSIDAALKRYNLLWWDRVIQHEIVEDSFSESPVEE